MSDRSIDVVVVERTDIFTSCPMSNLVRCGSKTLEDIRRSYHGLRQHGVRVLFDEASATVAALGGKAPNGHRKIANTCCGYAYGEAVIRISSVHTLNLEKSTLVTVPGAGGVTAARTALEGAYACASAVNIWRVMLG